MKDTIKGMCIFAVLAVVVTIGMSYLMKYMARLLVSVFPPIVPFLYHSDGAVAIFAAGVLAGIPFLLCVVIAGIYGAFSDMYWYIPVIQLIFVEIVWYLACLLLNVCFGISVASFKLFSMIKKDKDDER